MTHERKKFDDLSIEKLLMSRSIPTVPEDVKLRTLAAFRDARSTAADEMAREKRSFSLVMGIFIALIVMFGVVLALNMQLFSTVYAVLRDIAQRVSLTKSLETVAAIAKYAVVGLALIPAYFIARQGKKKHTSGR